MIPWNMKIADIADSFSLSIRSQYMTTIFFNEIQMRSSEHLKPIYCEIDTIHEIIDGGAMHLLNKILVQKSNKKKKNFALKVVQEVAGGLVKKLS